MTDTHHIIERICPKCGSSIIHKIVKIVPKVLPYAAPIIPIVFSCQNPGCKHEFTEHHPLPVHPVETPKNGQ